ncbi:ricin-type beta-trefoil lectin domain protein [Ceratobasidium sp. AG-Ba]|nr:ricin-type beta-trefoil lectin domain protein [Ceratobasidium sp. AG-Ba]
MALRGVPTGTYTLKNVSTGTVLDLSYGNAGDDIAINGFQSYGGENQRWRLEWTGKGHGFTLRNVKSGTYVSFEKFRNGIPITGSKKRQTWKIIVADGGYAIEAEDHRHYVFDIKASNPRNETAV